MARSDTTVKVLEAAAEIAGGRAALAHHLGIGETLLALFIAGERELPDVLLLRAIDVILADRTPTGGQTGTEVPQGTGDA